MAIEVSLARPTIEVAGLAAAYPGGARALRDVSFRIVGGRICGLAGPNGSGKSTLFKAIMGLIDPAAGAVRIDGGSVAAARRTGAIATAPQPTAGGPLGLGPRSVAPTAERVIGSRTASKRSVDG